MKVAFSTDKKQNDLKAFREYIFGCYFNVRKGGVMICMTN